MTRRALAAAAVALLAATACQDHTRKTGAAPTEPMRASASAAASARVSSVCAAYEKERSTRKTLADAKRGKEAESALAEIKSLDAAIADACAD